MKKNKIESMYVHIPFCKSICSYCDFAKFFYNEDYAKKYVDRLIEQIENNKPSKCSTIYIGGGTPSSLSASDLERLLSTLKKYLRKNGEFTIEVNPETIDVDKIRLFAKYEINRLSIGVESFDDEILKILNRKHTLKDIQNCVELANKYQISNYSFDFIYGISGQSMQMIKNDLETALSFSPKHLSFYSLQIEKNTQLYISKYPPLDEDKVREMYDFIYKFLKKNKYKRYEVSNFSLKGKESKHNLTYWNNKEYYAFGVGASSYINRTRINNSRDLLAFIRGENKSTKEIISDDDFEFEYIMLKLRLEKGISFNDYFNQFNEDFLKKYEDQINKLQKEKLLIVSKKRIKASYNGMMLLNYVIVELTKERL